MALSDFDIVDKIGKGAFSCVYKVIRKKDNATYAMKQIDINDLTFWEKSNALNEIRILASLDHPNVIAYREAFVDEPSATLWYKISQFFLFSFMFSIQSV